MCSMPTVMFDHPKVAFADGGRAGEVASWPYCQIVFWVFESPMSFQEIIVTSRGVFVSSIMRTLGIVRRLASEGFL
jgi:hypothetical protein